VDARGGAVIDPTKNVRELVLAESKYQDAMRDALESRLLAEIKSLRDIIQVISDGAVAFQNAQRDAETKRIDQLAQTRQEFQNTIRDMLAESVRTTSNLVSTQLVQIQATFDTRVTKLEAGAFTQAGKSSVADPAISDAMARLTANVNAISINTTEQINKMSIATTENLAKITASIAEVGKREEGTSATRMGQSQAIAWIVGAAMLVAAIASPMIAFLAFRSHQ